MTATRTEALADARQSVPTQPGPALRIDEPSAEHLTPEALLRSGGADWAQRLAAGERLEFRLEQPSRWSPAARRALLALFTQLREAGDWTLIVDGERVDDLFEPFVTGIAGPERPLAEQAQSREAAIEAAAAIHPGASELAADRIRHQLKRLGAKSVNYRQLLGQIQDKAAQMQLIGADSADREQAAPSARTSARAFCQGLRERAGLEADAPVVRHFRGQWYLWCDGGWNVTAEESLHAQLKRFQAQRGDGLDDGNIKQVMNHLEAEALLACADEEPPFIVAHAGATAPPHVEPCAKIAVANGLIDLDALALTGEVALEPPDPRCFTTWSLPVRYDPAATCPRWERFLEEALPRCGEGDRRREVLGEFYFVTLWRDCRYEKMLIQIGDGGNGKTTALRVLEAMLGRRNVSHVPFDCLGERFRLHELAGKRLNVSSEFDAPDRAQESRLKQLISGEPISDDRKHRPPRTVDAKAKLALACNTLPAFTPGDRGLWRRLLVLPFDQTFSEQRADVHLAERLITEERSGILNWILRHGVSLMRRGRFSDCRRCAAAAAAHHAAADPVRQFVDDHCRLDTAVVTECDALYDLFRYFWRTRLGVGGVPPCREVFGKRLRAAVAQRGGELTVIRPAVSDGRRPRSYKGISLSPDGEALLAERSRKGGRR